MQFWCSFENCIKTAYFFKLFWFLFRFSNQDESMPQVDQVELPVPKENNPPPTRIRKKRRVESEPVDPNNLPAAAIFASSSDQPPVVLPPRSPPRADMPQPDDAPPERTPDRPLGCPTCRGSKKGCHICRRPGYRPRGPRAKAKAKSRAGRATPKAKGRGRGRGRRCAAWSNCCTSLN